MYRIGFIGLGAMGKPMARNLLKAGFPLTVYNRSAASADELAEIGARKAYSPAETASNSDIVITMLPDTPDVLETALGNEGVIKTLAPGSLFIDMSTISPAASIDLYNYFIQAGSGFLDAPVTGGQIGAENASLSIMVGGRKSDFERARPCLEALGKTIVYMGEPGNGQKAKLCNQVICALNILAVCEGLILAKTSGLDCDRLLEAIAGGSAGSWMINNLAAKMLSEDWSPGFKIKLQEKDLRLAMQLADDLGLNLRGTALAKSVFEFANASGSGDMGTQALFKTLKILNNLAG